MKRYLLLIVLAGCNPACDSNAMRACGNMCGTPGVQSYGSDGCKCKPGSPTTTTTTTVAVTPNPTPTSEKAP